MKTRVNSCITLLLLSLFSICVVSCDSAISFYEKKLIIGGVWDYDNKVNFKVITLDTFSRLDIELDLSHSTDFFAQNLYVKITTIDPQKNTIEDIVSLELADKSGRWFGKCNESVCDLSIVLQTGAIFNQKGTYQIGIEQFSRKNPLKGINFLALRLVPFKR